MVEVDIEDALRYPVRGDDALAVHAVGGVAPVLVNLSMAVVAVAAIFVGPVGLLLLALLPLQLAVVVGWTGYFVRVARTTFAGATAPPPLGDWGSLARDGLWGSLVVLAYQVPLVALTIGGYALVFALLFGLDSAVDAGTEAGMAAGSVLGVLLMLILFVVVLGGSLLVAYLLPISLVAYAHEGSARATLSLETLRTVGLSSEYAVPWLVVAGIYGGTVGLMSLLTSLLVGYLLVPLLPLFYFYLGVAAFHLFAQAYVEERGLHEVGTAGGASSNRPAGPGGSRQPEDV